jgi:3D (Asp-Asp-Asp) domain-containing protein
LPALGCGADSGDGMGDTGGDNADKNFGSVQITNYTVALESELSGGDMICGQVDGDGADDCYPSDFLCSGHGVAMQGTGLGHDSDGNPDSIYIKWVSGGGGWEPHYVELNDCSSAKFKVVDAVIGFSGNTLTENYSVAIDRKVIGMGAYIWIDKLGHWFQAMDTGAAIIGNHIDVYTGKDNPGYNMSSSVFVTKTPHESNDDPPGN